MNDEEINKNTTMRKGSVVMLKRPMLGNNIYNVGVCYESYTLGNRTGLSFIFENGEYDGFSPEEQDLFLFEIDFSETISHYQFSNVIQLSDDFNYIKANALDFLHLPQHIRDKQKKIMIREEKIDSIIQSS